MVENPAGSAARAYEPLILMEGCSVGDALAPALEALSWSLERGQAWLVAGPTGGGKEAFGQALSGELRVRPREGGAYVNRIAGRVASVSFEAAAALLERERRLDDSDFVEGGVSEGTSVRRFIASGLGPVEAAQYPGGDGLEAHPAVAACGVAGVLERGLKRLSTGECRRALLCRAFLSSPALIVMAAPCEGLDADSRRWLRAELERLAADSAAGVPGAPSLVIVDEPERAPLSMNRVIELSGGAVSYRGDRDAYEAWSAGRGPAERRPAAPRAGPGVTSAASGRPGAGAAGAAGEPAARRLVAPLVELRDVTVSWSGRAVLDGLSWVVFPGEHWLVRGPNGSGKTTLLELITGDNPQAYANEVSVFGRRRGSGQSVWELKSRIGMVSYRLHLEFRRLDDSSVEDVLVSGLRDSIGLYGPASDAEREAARAWLSVLGLESRPGERFVRLSFGEQRAVLVARAAVKSPELLVLDEPCHGLDAGQRRLVLGLLAAIAERGSSTMIHVTHDPEEVQPFERRVLELRPGRKPSWAVVGSP